MEALTVQYTEGVKEKGKSLQQEPRVLVFRKMGTFKDMKKILALTYVLYVYSGVVSLNRSKKAVNWEFNLHIGRLSPSPSFDVLQVPQTET